MLVGISGKMGSGKNLVCTIIQGLTAAKKHNIENLSFEWIKKYYINSIWEQKAFASKLKQTASLLTGIPVEKFEDQEFKNTPIGEDWLVHWYIDRVGQKHLTLSAEEAIMADGRDSGQDLLTPRLLLQIIGTECIRDKVHPNAWVNALFADYKYEIHRSEVSTRAAGFIDQHVYPNWIITDMRFPNELEAVKSKGGITIRVNRPKNDLDNHKDCVKTEDGYCIQSENNYCKGSCKYEHPSEASLDSATFDFVINNDKDIKHLINEVKKILEKLSII